MAPGRSAFTQDLPPAGGYAPINWGRIPAKSYFSGLTLIGGFLAVTFGGFYVFSLTLKRLRRENLENNDAKLAIEPLLLAERDREFLKQIRRNRDDEEKLMKNVPGWETGTCYGEPIFKSIPKDSWIDPLINELYVHANQKDMYYNKTISWRQ